MPTRHPTPRIASIIPFTLPLLALCADQVQVAAQPTVPVWHVEPVARAGAGDGPGALTIVGGATVGRDGTLYLAQPQEQRIKAYDRSGRYLRSIGQEGSGPGEFEWPSALGWRGDTLWVADAPQTRISLFLPTGEFARAITFSRASPHTDGRVHIPGSLLADGSVLGFWQAPLSLLAQRQGVIIPMVRFRDSGEPIGLLTRRESRNEFGQLRGENTSTYFPQLFSDSPLVGVSPDGSAIVTVRREAASAGRTATFTVQRMEPSGRTTFLRNYQYRPLPLSNEAVERAIEQQVSGMANARMRTPEAAALRRELRENLYRPRYLPPVNSVVLGRDGTIWLRREDLGRSHAWWHVLDARGQLIGRAWIPANLNVRYADRTQIWAEERDELDVPTFVRLRVVPSR